MGVFDTEWSESVGVDQVIERTSASPDTELPCAFLSGLISKAAMSTSMLTSLRGYLQMSYSTATELDNRDLFPLHSRITPSLVQNVQTMLKYLSQIGVTHLAALHTSSRESQSFSVALQRVIATEYPDVFELVSVDVPDDNLTPEILRDAVFKLKETGFRYFFGGVKLDHLENLLLEAVDQEIAGTGEHVWILPGGEGWFNEKRVERDSPIALASPGIMLLSLSGALKDDAFEKLSSAMSQLGQSKSDLDFILSKFPTYPDVIARNALFFEPFIYNPNFLQTKLATESTMSWSYDSAIATGLAACHVSATGKGLTGDDHFRALQNVSFVGTTGDVSFDPVTGTRLNAQHRIANIQTSSEKSNDTHVGFQAVETSHYRNGEFVNLAPFIYNDNTTSVPADLVPVDVETNYLSPALRIAALSMCGLVVMLSFSFCVWTHLHATARVVRSAQPIFLHILCLGVVMVALAIVPLSFDEGASATLDGCDKACRSVPFFYSIGFSLTFSALWAKTHRINRILQNPNAFQRIKVSAMDVGRPIILVLLANLAILTLWTVLAPLQCETEFLDWDKFGRPTESRGYCVSENETESIAFSVTLAIFTFGPVIFAVYEAYKARHISTEFSETEYILKALVVIVLACFIGVPVWIIANDNPSASFFAAVAINFAICMSILLFIFGPKLMAHYKWKMGPSTNRPRLPSRFARSQFDGHDSEERIPPHLSQINNLSEGSGRMIQTENTGSSSSNDTGGEGVRIVNHPAALKLLEQKNEQLIKENGELRHRLNSIRHCKSNEEVLQLLQRQENETPTEEQERPLQTKTSEEVSTSGGSSEKEA